jgi:hypothetical protein
LSNLFDDLPQGSKGFSRNVCTKAAWALERQILLHTRKSCLFGRRIATTGKMLSPPGACITLSLPDDADTISSINFNPIGDALCASGWDGKVNVWNWDSKAHKATIDFDYPVLDTAWKVIAGMIALLSLATELGLVFRIMPPCWRPVATVFFSRLTPRLELKQLLAE